MNPKHTGTKLGIVLAVLTVIALVVGWNLLLPSRLTPTKGEATVYSPTLYPAQIEALAESCGDVYSWNSFKPENYPLLPKSALNEANLVVPVIENITVPVIGYLAPGSLPKSDVKFYSRTADPHFKSYQVLRLMYDYNATVIWYDATISPDVLRSIQRYVKSHPLVMALPWNPADQRNAPLPRGSAIAYASWGMSQNCLNWSEVVFDQYQDIKAQHPVRHVPEGQLVVGSRADSGSLRPIDPLLLAQLRKVQPDRFSPN